MQRCSKAARCACPRQSAQLAGFARRGRDNLNVPGLSQAEARACHSAQLSGRVRVRAGSPREIPPRHASTMQCRRAPAGSRLTSRSTTPASLMPPACTPAHTLQNKPPALAGQRVSRELPRRLLHQMLSQLQPSGAATESGPAEERRRCREGVLQHTAQAAHTWLIHLPQGASGGPEFLLVTCHPFLANITINQQLLTS